MKDELWNRLKSFGKAQVTGQSVDEAEGDRSQQTMEKELLILKTELALKEHFLHSLFFSTLLQGESMSMESRCYVEAINETLSAGWNFFKSLDIENPRVDEREIKAIRAYLTRVNSAAEKVFALLEGSEASETRLGRLHSLLIRKHADSEGIDKKEVI